MRWLVDLRKILCAMGMRGNVNSIDIPTAIAKEEHGGMRFIWQIVGLYAVDADPAVVWLSVL